MITGVHTMFYSSRAQELARFFAISLSFRLRMFMMGG